jgi:hypothetical protein
LSWNFASTELPAGIVKLAFPTLIECVTCAAGPVGVFPAPIVTVAVSLAEHDGPSAGHDSRIPGSTVQPDRDTGPDVLIDRSFGEAVATTPVCADVADPDPPALLAVSTTRIVLPTSELCSV